MKKMLQTIFKDISNKFRKIFTPLFPSGKYFKLIFVLALGVIGYYLGPRDLATGKYRAEIKVDLPDCTTSVFYLFKLGDETGKIVTQTQTAGNYKLILQGNDSYILRLGQVISYQLKVMNDADQVINLSLDRVSSTIIGEDYSQVLPPTGSSGQWLEFNLRVPYKSSIATGLLFTVAMLWLTELVPLSAASLLIPVVVVVTSVTDPATILHPFFHPIVVLFFAGFLLAEGMHRTGVDRIIALNILKHASLEPAFLMVTMMGLTAFLSLWMSNTASVAIIIPIAIAVLEKFPGDLVRTGFRRALLLGIAYAATIGGIGSAIGTPANILAMTFLNDFANADLGFLDWFYFGLPVVVIMIPIIWLYLIVVFRVQFHSVSSHLSHVPYIRELEALGNLKKDQRILLFVFIAIMGLWLTDRWHHIHTAIIALGGVIILFFTETIKKDDLNQINWDALLTFGGGLALGNLLVLTGVSDWIALQLTGLVNLPPLIVIFLVAGLTLFIGAFISNTACAAALIPLVIPLAQILHMDPRLLVAVVAIASSIDFALVVGTPPTMIAYSTGFFEAREIFNRGIVLDLIGIVILSFGVIWIWSWLGIITF